MTQRQRTLKEVCSTLKEKMVEIDKRDVEGEDGGEGEEGEEEEEEGEGGGGSANTFFHLYSMRAHLMYKVTFFFIPFFFCLVFFSYMHVKDLG